MRCSLPILHLCTISMWQTASLLFWDRLYERYNRGYLWAHVHFYLHWCDLSDVEYNKDQTCVPFYFFFIPMTYILCETPEGSAGIFNVHYMSHRSSMPRLNIYGCVMHNACKTLEMVIYLQLNLQHCNVHKINVYRCKTQCSRLILHSIPACIIYVKNNYDVTKFYTNKCHP